MNNTTRSATAIAGVFVSALAVAQIANAQIARRDALRQRIEWLKSTDSPEIDGAVIAAGAGIVQLYERRGYELAWIENGSGLASTQPTLDRAER